MKTIQFKGTDTIATILSNFGKIKEGTTKPFTLTINVASLMSHVAMSCTPTKEEKAQALATLTASELATLTVLQDKVVSHAKGLASARVSGQTSERWTVKGEASLG